MSKQIQDQETSIHVMKRAWFTGFVGGFLFSLLGTIVYYFNFVEVSPKAMLLRSWLRVPWTDRWPGDVLSWFIAGALSSIAAFVYFAVLRKIGSMWAGVAYGAVLWAAVFFLAVPLLHNIPSIGELSIDSIVTSLSLYVLYGTFVGFSISYDYYDTMINSKAKVKS